MNIEELKLVLETVGAVSEDAANVALAWVALPPIISLIKSVLFLVFLMYLVGRVARLVQAHMAAEQERRFEQREGSYTVGTMKVLRDQLGVGCPGNLTKEEVDEVAARVLHLLAMANAQKEQAK